MRSGSARVGGTGVAGEERLTGLRLVIVLQLKFLKGEEGARALEGVGRTPGGDHRLDVAVPGVQPAVKVEHLARFRDGLANVTKFVGEALEMGALLVDAGVALRDGPQLGLEEDSTVHLVVVEDVLDGAPEGERGDARAVDDVEDTFVDGGVDPIDDRLVDLPPLGGALSHGRRRADELVEAELPKDGLEEAPPLLVVRGRQVKENGNVGTDVHLLHDGGGSRLWCIW